MSDSRGVYPKTGFFRVRPNLRGSIKKRPPKFQSFSGNLHGSYFCTFKNFKQRFCTQRVGF